MSVKRDSAHVRRHSSLKLRRIPRNLLAGSDGSATDASGLSHSSESPISRSTEEDTSATSTDLFSDGCIAKPVGKPRHRHRQYQSKKRDVDQPGSLMRHKSSEVKSGGPRVVITAGMPSVSAGRGHSSTVGSDTKAERDEEVVIKISQFFNPYELVIRRLKNILIEYSHRHRLDENQMHKLLQWVDWDPSRLQVVSEAWGHQQFWPFVSSVVASRMVQEFPPLIVARLSSSKAGMITVTRLDLRSKHHSRRKTRATHKQHNVIADTAGLLAVRTTLARESMNFADLLDFLHRSVCPYCLNNIRDVSAVSNRKEERTTFSCGHSYHSSCLLFGHHCELCSSKDSSETESHTRAHLARGYIGTGHSSASESSPKTKREHISFHARSDSDASVATVTDSVMGSTPTPSETVVITPETKKTDSEAVGFSIQHRHLKKPKPSRRTDSLIRREAASLAGKCLRSAAETPSSERVKMISMMMDQDGRDLIKVGHTSHSSVKHTHHSLKRTGHSQRPVAVSHHRKQSSGDPERSSAMRSREVRRKFGGSRRR